MSGIEQDPVARPSYEVHNGFPFRITELTPQPMMCPESLIFYMDFEYEPISDERNNTRSSMA